MLPIFAKGFREREHRLHNQALLRKRRLLRRDSDPFNLPNQRFIELFRLSKELTRDFIESLRPHLPQRLEQFGITIDNMVLATLRFYATGSYQRCVGEEYNFGMAQSTMQKYVHLVTDAIHDNIVDNKILFPTTEDERNLLKMQFLNRWGFPGTVGAIDGTHVAI